MPREFTESDVFVLLAKQRRRLLLRVLKETSAPLHVDELVHSIAEQEYGSPSDEDRRAVYLSLYHNHLPRLEDAEVIEYNIDDGAIAPGLHFDSLVRVFERTSELDLPWNDD